MILKESIDDLETSGYGDLEGTLIIPTMLVIDDRVDIHEEDNIYDYDVEKYSLNIEDYSGIDDIIMKKKRKEVENEIIEDILYWGDDDFWGLLPEYPENKTYRVKVKISFYYDFCIDDYSFDEEIGISDLDISDISIDEAELLN